MKEKIISHGLNGCENVLYCRQITALIKIKDAVHRHWWENCVADCSQAWNSNRSHSIIISVLHNNLSMILYLSMKQTTESNELEEV